MDIENTWNNSGGSDEMLNQLLQHERIATLHSKLPLKRLKRNLFTGILWAVLITAAYVVLCFFFGVWQVYVPLIVTAVFNVWLMLTSWKLYQSIPETISANSLKQELEKNLNSFKQWWRIQQRVSLFVYPVAAAGGFVLGGILGSGKTAEAFLYQPKVVVALLITIAALMPVSYWLAKWLFGRAYGKHLKNLEMMLKELS